MGAVFAALWAATYSAPRGDTRRGEGASGTGEMKKDSADGSGDQSLSNLGNVSLCMSRRD